MENFEFPANIFQGRASYAKIYILILLKNKTSVRCHQKFFLDSFIYTNVEMYPAFLEEMSKIIKKDQKISFFFSNF